MKNNDYVVVLGSGQSINNLTIHERKIIDSFDVKIAINKYSAFYEKAQIRPTHIYFLDDYDNRTISFFMYILKKLKKDKIQDLNIIISDRYKNCLNSNPINHYFLYFKNMIFKKLENSLIYIGYILISRFSFNFYCKIKYKIKKFLPHKNGLRYFLVSKTWKKEYLVINSTKDPFSKWATTITEPMFHYRGSLTTVLNYISIKFPNKKILFVGVDLNASAYFFEEELNKFHIQTDDWTTSISKKENKHFSIIDYQGTKIDDIFTKMVDNLQKSGNSIFSINRESYLVEKGFIKTIKL